MSKKDFIWPIITKESETAVINQLHEAISIYDRSSIYLKFENAFSKYHKRKYALTTNAGTTAIYSMFVGAGITQGDEVICPVYTFFATVTPLLFVGAIPVFVDCGKDGNIDPQKIEEKITKKTKGIIVTHMWGVPCDMEKIVNIAKKYKLKLFEDCSHAHGATFKGKTVGSFSDASAWSLQGQKIITGGELGILTTNNSEIYYRALLLGHFNKRSLQEIPKNNKYHKYAITGMGLKLRANPIGVALANEQFSKLHEILVQKRRFAKKLTKAIKRMNGLEVPKFEAIKNPAWYAYVFQFVPEKMNLTIKEFYQKAIEMGAKELDMPFSTCPLTHFEIFKTPGFLFKTYGTKNFTKGTYDNAERFYNNALKLPVWTRESDEKYVDKYINILTTLCLKYGKK